ncbi:EAL domain-containing protein [Sphingomonas piscis]|uniref:EAL domain-containing protein n=1 Tax=Sphingomonas piscis TaxID=2714943 RepID=A0A6G7YSJ9_9SPHN|nr:EAL domain-containing protein [Sphingomonas piscis]QIK79712.1 EAL domain-containing protein [Sphingomonas piscis]
MTKITEALRWGKRISDQPSGALRRDLLLEEVIARQGVQVHYQPQVALADGTIKSVEALARWGVEPSADRLFARAHASGLTERLSRLMQRKALRAAATWEGPLKGLGLSINLLPQDICRPGYEQWLMDEMEEAGVNPRRVTLELTESALLDDHQLVAGKLAALREVGVRIAVDDFGTGYASLAYLIRLPLDVVKIDRVLVSNIVHGERDQIVMKAMIRLAHDLGLQVLVEGVEDEAQLHLLAEWGCDHYQGFLAAGALDEYELRGFLAN